MLKKINKLIISRTDAIGDVILTIPIAGILKNLNKNIQIVFLGQNYTKDIIESSEFIDEFISWDNIKQKTKINKINYFKSLNADAIIHVFPNKEIAQLSKKASIKYRIGTTHRIFHLFTCNKLINLGRKNSNLHEAQLNIKLLKAFNIKTDFELKELPNFYGFNKPQDLIPKINNLIDKNKFNIILHPKSNGSAREWGLQNFLNLIEILPVDKYKIFITGTEIEKKLLKDLIYHKKITDLTGKLSLKEFIAFISKTDGLVAASTGPLHIAAAFGKKAIGIYPPISPMNPQRWAPIGKNSSFLVLDKKCNKCKNGNTCECMLSITATQVYNKLKN